MTIKRFVLFTLSVVFLTTLVGCGIFAPQPTATPVPTATFVPTATSTPTEIPTPTPTATPVPLVISILEAHNFTLDDSGTCSTPCKTYFSPDNTINVSVYDNGELDLLFDVEVIDNKVAINSKIFTIVEEILDKKYGNSMWAWVLSNLNAARSASKHLNIYSQQLDDKVNGHSVTMSFHAAYDPLPADIVLLIDYK